MKGFLFPLFFFLTFQQLFYLLRVTVQYNHSHTDNIIKWLYPAITSYLCQENMFVFLFSSPFSYYSFISAFFFVVFVSFDHEIIPLFYPLVTLHLYTHLLYTLTHILTQKGVENILQSILSK